MSKVEFVYGKGGKTVSMARRTAEALRRLGHGTYADEGYNTRMITAAPPPPPAPEAQVSEALAAFAAENEVDLKTVVGTGKDGKARKSDIEAVIAARG